MRRRTLLVGNDTDDSGSGGLQTLGLDGDLIVSGQTLDVVSPTYLAQHGDLVFAVSESSPGMVHSFRLDRGTFPMALTRISTAQVGRDGACHLAVTGDGRFLLTACYGSGSATLHRVLPDGRVTDAVDIFDFTGSGPDAERQESAHAHQVVPDGDEVLVPDLGSDRVHRLLIRPDGVLELLGGIVLPPGFGPRHLVLDGDRIFVAGELSAQLWVGRRTAGAYATIGVLPVSAHPGQYPAAIRLASRRLLISNRGVDTITEFDVAGPLPIPVREFHVGAWPRDFVLDGPDIWVGYQRGGAVACHAMEGSAPMARLTATAKSPAGLLLIG